MLGIWETLVCTWVCLWLVVCGLFVPCLFRSEFGFGVFVGW